MYTRLVANGCSYINQYALGSGHVELGHSMGIIPNNIHTLAQNGASNSRIIRTTLSDCYNNTIPTMYIIGITFNDRFELPVIAIDRNHNNNVDKYVSFSGQFTEPDMPLDYGLDMTDIIQYGKLRLKFNIFSEQEEIIKLVYAITSMIDSIINQGHTVVVFNTAELAFERFKNLDEIKYISNYKQIVENLHWYSNTHQYTNGAKFDQFDIGRNVDDIYKHIAMGDHSALNSFLLNYIRTNKIA